MTALNIQWWQIVIFFLLILVSPILLIQLSIRSDDNKLQKERNKNYKETGYRKQIRKDAIESIGKNLNEYFRIKERTTIKRQAIEKQIRKDAIESIG